MNAQMNIEMNTKMNNGMDMKMKFNEEEKVQMGIAEGCNVSAYSMFAFAGGILMAIGTVIYSVIAM